MAAQPDAIRPEELLLHAKRLRRLALKLVRDGDDADDLVQDTWLDALRRPPRADRAPWPWLARVLANRAKNRRRDDARRREREADRANEASAPAPDEIAGELEAQRALVEAVLELDEPERTIVTLRWFRELDSNAIGERLGLPPGTVRWRLARAMETLRRKLDAHFGDRSAWAALLVPLERVLPAASSAAAVSAGAFVMSGAMKLGIAAVVVAVGGWIWIGTDVERDAPSVERERVATGLDPQAERAVATDATEAAPSERASSEPARRALDAAAGPPEQAPESAVAAPSFAEARVIARLIGTDGEPLSDGTLSAEQQRESYVARAADDGHVELALPSLGQRAWSQSLVAAAPGCATRFLETNLQADATVELGEIALELGGSIRGRVVDEAGRGVADALVRPVRGELPPYSDEAQLRLHGFGVRPGLVARTDEAGAFELDGLEPGAKRVWAEALGKRHDWSDPIEVAAGATVEGIELVAAPLRKEDVIRGHVLDPDGRPVAGARVAVIAAKRGGSSSTTIAADGEGTFGMIALFDAPHSFMAADPAERWGATGVEGILPGTHDLVLRLGERRVVTVRVRDERGKPIERFGYVVKASNGSLQTHNPVEFRPEGAVQVAPHGLGSLIEVRAPGHRRLQQGPFDPLRPPDEVVFTLEQLPALAGRVTIDGEPAPGATVELRQGCDIEHTTVDGFPARSMPTGVSTTTDADGRFSIETEEEGELFVRAEAPGRAWAELGPWSFDAASLPKHLELALPRGGAIDGRVLLADGRDPAGTIVGVNCGDGRPRTQRVGADGRFRFEALAPGIYEVTRCDTEIDPRGTEISTGPDRHAFEPECTVLEGRTTRFDLDLRGPHD